MIIVMQHPDQTITEFTLDEFNEKYSSVYYNYILVQNVKWTFINEQTGKIYLKPIISQNSKHHQTDNKIYPNHSPVTYLSPMLSTIITPKQKIQISEKEFNKTYNYPIPNFGTKSIKSSTDNKNRIIFEIVGTIYFSAMLILYKEFYIFGGFSGRNPFINFFNIHLQKEILDFFQNDAKEFLLQYAKEKPIVAIDEFRTIYISILEAIGFKKEQEFINPNTSRTLAYYSLNTHENSTNLPAVIREAK